MFSQLLGFCQCVKDALQHDVLNEKVHVFQKNSVLTKIQAFLKGLCAHMLKVSCNLSCASPA